MQFLSVITLGSLQGCDFNSWAGLHVSNNGHETLKLAIFTRQAHTESDQMPRPFFRVSWNIQQKRRGAWKYSGTGFFQAMLKLAKAQRGRKPITTSQTCNWEMGLWGELCMRSIIVFGQLPVIDLLERLPSTPLGQVE